MDRNELQFFRLTSSATGAGDALRLQRSLTKFHEPSDFKRGRRPAAALSGGPVIYFPAVLTASTNRDKDCATLPYRRNIHRSRT
jgi:hypothetical protein